MRCCAVPLLICLPVCAADRPIPPEEAGKHIGDRITVEMEVKAVGNNRNKTMYFLNSKPDHRDKDNFTVVFKAKGINAFKEAKIDDLKAHFQGKKIRVTGTVTRYDGKPQIEVTRTEQVEIVKK